MKDKILNNEHVKKILDMIQIYIWKAKLDKLKLLIETFLNKYELHLLTLAMLAVILVILVSFYSQPETLSNMLKTGSKYIEEGNNAKALKIYTKITRKFPDSYEGHLQLARVYKQIKEKDRAKIEYYRAMKLNYLFNFDAYFELAQMYVDEDNYEFAEEIIRPLKKKTNLKTLKKRIGDFYYNWGNHLSNKLNQKSKAIRKYKIAIEYYEKSDKELVDHTKETIVDTYIDIANNYSLHKQNKDAIKILKMALDYRESATIHYELSQLYKTFDLKAASEELKKTIYMEPENERFLAAYINILIAQAEESIEKQEFKKAKLFYESAKKYKEKYQFEIVKKRLFVVNILGIKYNELPKSDETVPGISFKITNNSNKLVNKLETKVIFLKNGKYFSSITQKIIGSKNLLKPDETTDEIIVFSPNAMKKLKSHEKIKIKVFLSNQLAGGWSLYRVVDLKKDANQDIKSKKQESTLQSHPHKKKENAKHHSQKHSLKTKNNHTEHKKEKKHTANKHKHH